MRADRGCGAEQAVGLLQLLAGSCAEMARADPGSRPSAGYHRENARAAVVELFARLAGRRPTREEFARVMRRAEQAAEG